MEEIICRFGSRWKDNIKTPYKIFIIILIYCIKLSVITIYDILKNVIMDILPCRDANGGRSLTK